MMQIREISRRIAREKEREREGAFDTRRTGNRGGGVGWRGRVEEEDERRSRESVGRASLHLGRLPRAHYADNN